MSKGPAIIAMALLCTEYVDLKHVGAAIGLSASFIKLAPWCTTPFAVITLQLQLRPGSDSEYAVAAGQRTRPEPRVQSARGVADQFEGVPDAAAPARCQGQGKH